MRCGLRTRTSEAYLPDPQSYAIQIFSLWLPYALNLLPSTRAPEESSRVSPCVLVLKEIPRIQADSLLSSEQSPWVFVFLFCFVFLPDAMQALLPSPDVLLWGFQYGIETPLSSGGGGGGLLQTQYFSSFTVTAPGCRDELSPCLCPPY